MVNAGTNSRRMALVIAFLMTGLLLAIPIYADAEEYEYESGNDLAGSFGEAAWTIGTPLTGLYVAYRFALRLDPRRVARILSPPIARRLHAVTSIFFGGLALAHAYLNRVYATVLEYALVSVLVLTMLSGALLYKVASLPPSGRKIIYRIHAQRVLALLLLILALIHVAQRG